MNGHHRPESIEKIRAYWTSEQRERFRKIHTGVHPSEETREKIRKATAGKNNPNFGKTAPPEVREKQRKAKLGKKLSMETRRKMSEHQRRGEHNNFWQGGGFEDKYGAGFTKTLKNQIRARDGFACFICGIGEGVKHHDIHHIDYDKHNNDPKNLITLCHSCHLKTGSRRELWLLYFGKQ